MIFKNSFYFVNILYFLFLYINFKQFLGKKIIKIVILKRWKQKNLNFIRDSLVRGLEVELGF